MAPIIKKKSHYIIGNRQKRRLIKKEIDNILSASSKKEAEKMSSSDNNSTYRYSSSSAAEILSFSVYPAETITNSASIDECNDNNYSYEGCVYNDNQDCCNNNANASSTLSDEAFIPQLPVENKCNTIKDDLRSWAIAHDIPKTTVLTPLLKILQSHGIDVP